MRLYNEEVSSREIAKEIMTQALIIYRRNQASDYIPLGVKVEPKIKGYNMHWSYCKKFVLQHLLEQGDIEE